MTKNGAFACVLSAGVGIALGLVGGVVGPAVALAPAWDDASLVANSAAAAATGCNARVMMAFASEMKHAPSDRFVAKLGRASNVHLTFVRVISNNMFLFALSGTPADTDCRLPIDRLRHNSQVRMVDIDGRRQAN